MSKLVAKKVYFPGKWFKMYIDHKKVFVQFWNKSRERITSRSNLESDLDILMSTSEVLSNYCNHDNLAEARRLVDD